MSGKWWKDGIRFECQGSGKCCLSRGTHGYVYLTLEDRRRFARHFGTPEKPAAISEREAQTILQRVQEGVDKPRPKVLYEPGEVVRVIDGPFNDFNGVVEEVNYEKSRLRVAVLIFGRSTPVELEFGQVEKA